VSAAVKQTPHLGAAGAAGRVDLDGLNRSANSLGSLINGDKPATAEARVVDAGCRKVAGFVGEQAALARTVAST
jgi:hypothetical protein